MGNHYGGVMGFHYGGTLDHVAALKPAVVINRGLLKPLFFFPKNLPRSFFCLTGRKGLMDFQLFQSGPFKWVDRVEDEAFNRNAPFGIYCRLSRKFFGIRL